MEPFRGQVTGGRWAWDGGERERFAAMLSTMTDGPYLLSLSHPTRSQRANAYYWSVVLGAIAEHTGYTADDVHDAMCQQFLSNDLKRVEFYNAHSQDVLRVAVDTRRSSKRTTVEFYEFVERVRAWAGEFLGLTIPDPDPDYWRRRTT